jgi:hypothetical protein
MKGFNGEEKDGPEAKQDGQGEENKNDPMGQLGEKIGQACKSAMGGGDQDGAMDTLKKGLEQMCSKISGVGGGGEEKASGMQQEGPGQDQGMENKNTSPTMKMG